jgi:FG-GAP-like repeat/IPT/TIG domain
VKETGMPHVPSRWFKNLRTLLGRSAARPQRRRTRLGFDSLEDRVTPASVISVTASGLSIAGGNGDLRAGQVAELTVNFDTGFEFNLANGFPSLSLNDGGVAVYAGDLGAGAQLNFDYTVTSGQNTPDLAVTAFNLNGTTITDFHGNPATLAGAVGNPAGTLQIDTTAPTAQITFGSEQAGANGSAQIAYDVSFSEPVTDVAASQFSVNQTAGSAGIVSKVQALDASHYVVTATFPAGSGTVGLDLVGTNIKDLAGNGFGGGSFSLGTPLATGVEEYSQAVADLNGDGIPDVVTATDDKVVVQLGTSSGTFAAAIGSPLSFNNGSTETSPFFVAVADVNGDGWPDIITANYSTQNVSVFLGNGDGTFNAPIFSPVAGMSSLPSSDRSPFHAAIGDVNGDSEVDIVVSTGGGEIFVLLGNGTGKFANAVGSPYPNASDQSTIVIQDMNGDGKPDIVTGSGASDQLHLLLNSGNGTFIPDTAATIQGVNPKITEVADVNRDGIPDIVTLNSSGSLTVLLGTSNGGFAAAPGSPFALGSAGEYQPESLSIGDVNGDGIPDLLVTNLEGILTTETVFLGTGDGSFQADPSMVPSFGNGVEVAVLEDMNGDGRPDLVFSGRGTPVTQILLNSPIPQAGPTFVLPTITSISPTIAAVGQILTINGASFSPTLSGDSVEIGNVPAVVDSATSTEMTVTVPAGYGNDLPVTVTANGITSNAVDFNYAPAFVGIQNNSGPTTGGTSFVITFANFNGTDGTVSAMINGAAVSVGDIVTIQVKTFDANGHVDGYDITGTPGRTILLSEFTFVSPVGAGASQPVQVFFGGNPVNSDPDLVFNYDPPVVTAVTDSFAGNLLPTSGGVPVTLTGSNFGPPATLVTLFVGGVPVRPTTVTDNSLTFIAPPGVGTQTILLTVNGQSTTTTVSYAPPSFLGIKDNAGPTKGGTSFVVAFANLVAADGSVSAMIDGTSASVTGVVTNLVETFGADGHVDGFNDITGASGSSIVLSEVTFVSPAGVGAGQPVQVFIGGKTLGSNPDLVFNYDPPLVTAVTDSFAGNLLPTSGGVPVTLTGSNFGTTSSLITLFVGGVSVTPTTVSDNSLTFIAPSGFGTQTIDLTVDGQSTVTTVGYAAPSFLGIKNNSGPASGGTTFVVAFANLVPADGSVSAMIDGASASVTGVVTNLVETFGADGHVDGFNDITGTSGSSIVLSEVTFVSPAGVGAGQTVQVTIGGKTLAPAPDLVFNYAPPSVTAVTDSLAGNLLPTSSSIPVTLTGSNFGTNLSLVSLSVGGVTVTPTAVSDKSLTFVSPLGVGTETLLVVIDGQSTTTTLTYAPPAFLGIENNVGPAIGGTTFVVAGTNFGNAIGDITAKVNGTNASVAGFIANVVMTRDSNGQIPGFSGGTPGIAGSTVTFSEVTLVTPPGLGVDDPVTITVGGQSNSSVSGLVFTYVPPPVVTGASNSVDGNVLPTAGGVPVTLSGSNFGTTLSGVSVTIDGAFVPVTAVSGSTLVFTAPPGVGIQKPLTVTVDGQTTTTFISYAPPSFLGIQNNFGPLNGGTSFVVAGLNLGNAIGDITALVNGTSASVTGLVTNVVETRDANGQLPGFSGGTPGAVGATVTFSEVTLVSPAGAGINDAVALIVGGQQIPVTSGLVFTYMPPPVVTGASNSVDGNVLPTAGGVPVTLSGSNFGTTLSLVSVTINGTSAPVTAVSGSSLVFTAPPGVGTQNPISVSVDGQSTTTFISYAPPAIATASVAGNVLPTAGGGSVTLTGSNFGTMPSLVTVSVGGVPGTVTAVSDGSIVFIAPPGFGPETILLTVDGQSATSMINYAPPVFLGIENNTGPAIGGASVVVAGANLGNSIADITASVSGTNASVTGIVANVTATLNSLGQIPGFTGTAGAANATITFSEVTLIAPAGTGLSHPISITVDGQSMAPAAGFVVNYAPPVISAATVANNLLPTAGGVPVTLTGSNFGTLLSKVTLSVGGVPATLMSVSDGSIVFTAPPGVGTETILLTVDGQSGTSTISYSPPTIVSAGPSSGPASGGTQLTIDGTNFGVNPQLTVGTATAKFVSLANIVVNGTPEQQLVVTTPAGGGSNLSVVVSNGNQKSNAATFSYVPVLAPTATAQAANGVLAVSTVVAVDGVVPLTYTIAGGVDASAFRIDPASGLLSFASPPSFSHPTDSNKDNVYNVIVQASDGVTSSTEALAVKVTSVALTAQTVYVNSAWSNLPTGTLIANTDPTAATPQFATIGVNAFPDMQGGIDAATGTIDLLGGSYTQPTTFSRMLTVSVSQGVATIAGNLVGTALLVKTGNGTLALSGKDSDTGNQVLAGTLLIDGTLTSSGTTTVGRGATLGGAGTIAGAVTSSGIVSPGDPTSLVGTLTTGSLAFVTGSTGAGTLSLNLSSPTSYDHLVVPSINLASATLSINVGTGLATGDQFTIVSIAGKSGGLTGKFNGLAEGATFAVGNRDFRINYAAGDGNDIVLTDVTPVPVSSVFSALFAYVETLLAAAPPVIQNLVTSILSAFGLSIPSSTSTNSTTTAATTAGSSPSTGTSNGSEVDLSTVFSDLLSDLL